MSARRLTGFAIVIAVALSGCADGERLAFPDSARHSAEREDNGHQVAQQSAGVADTPIATGILTYAAAAPVEPWTETGHPAFRVALRSREVGPGHARRFGTITLPTALRDSVARLGQFPCTSCHMGRRIVMKDERIGDAHRNIRAQHPRQTGATCSTCHSPDDVAQLSLRNGARTSLDHAYRLCAQCHFTQVEAWAGGAHGKRLDGWQGSRVVMGCADCHDPHGPTIEPRIPFRAPRLTRSGRSTQ